MNLKIPFHPYQPTFGSDVFCFFFLFLPKYRTLFHRTVFLNGTTPKKKKKLHQMCYCDVRTSQQSLRYTNNANKICEISPKKFWLSSWTPPKGFDKSTRLVSKNCFFAVLVQLCTHPRFHERSHIFLFFTSEFVEIRTISEMKTNICGNALKF